MPRKVWYNNHELSFRRRMGGFYALHRRFLQEKMDSISGTDCGTVKIG